MTREVPCVFLIITSTVLSNNSRAFSSFLASGCTGFCTPTGFMFVILETAAGNQGQCSCAASQRQFPHADKHLLRNPIVIVTEQQVAMQLTKGRSMGTGSSMGHMSCLTHDL